MKGFILLVLGMVALIVCSCGKKEETPVQEHKIGKYIYRDDNDIHHVNSCCIKLRHGKDDTGHEIYAMLPMDTSQFVITDIEYFRVCSRCVDDEIYNRILKISERNSQY